MAEYAFCEPVWATTRSREHIREVPGDQLKVGGGIDKPALCGFDLAGGWDIPRLIDELAVRRGLRAECNPVCPRCADLWAAAAGVEDWTPTAPPNPPTDHQAPREVRAGEEHGSKTETTEEKADG
jgi:hypothetical protein